MQTIRKISSLIRTIKHLRVIQIVYQLKYRFNKPLLLGRYQSNYSPDNLYRLCFREIPPVHSSWNGERGFTFLSKRVDFRNDIVWEFRELGKLWNYNLQYANYLLQSDISNDAKKEAMKSLYTHLSDGRLILEPYPVSLRTINMIRWFCKEGLDEPELLPKLYAELDFLSKRLEFHLLGNHLLENAFALIMGGAYFSNKHWLALGKQVLNKELNEQVLSDGGHFELSPMYHQIIFFRILELIDWYSEWPKKEIHFEKYLIYKARDMRAWLENISFQNGDIPHFNDSANDIAYPTSWLLNYADNLSISSSKVKLNVTGYRSIKKKTYECKIDFAQVGPNYQPGHAHADTLSFVLYCSDKPVLVDTGTSTYEAGKRRSVERQTSSHNTVTVENKSQSEIYGAFRVGRRAKTVIIKDGPSSFSAIHDGYLKSFGLKHQRTFDFYDAEVKIEDDLVGQTKKNGVAHFHFHPTIDIAIEGNVVVVKGIGHIHFDGGLEIEKQLYDFASGFNNTVRSFVIRVTFEKKLSTNIVFD